VVSISRVFCLKHLCLTALGLLLFVFPAAGQAFAGVPSLVSQAAVVMDASTGTVIFSKNPDEEIPPASLTKLMTMHLAFKEIAAGKASLDEIITLPRESWAVNQPPHSSLMYLALGHKVSLRELLLGMAVFSGNDAAAAVALRFAPSVEDFAEMMNREAAMLGLNKTRFVDAAGYWEQNLTTAGEFAEFCRFYIAEYPQSLRDYHSVREFSYPLAENLTERYRNNPGTRVHRNHNTLLGRIEGVDGLKTGFIPESGYNIALTAEQNGTRFIAVVLGAPSSYGGDRLRDEDGKKLLTWAFEFYKTIRPNVGALEPVRIWKGKENYAAIIPGAALEFTALAERGEYLSWHIECEDPVIAPLPAGSRIGKLVLYDNLGELRQIPLVTSREAGEGGFFKRIFDSIRLFFRRPKIGPALFRALPVPHPFP
jgi:D-alanyl-D-alanine carboxypeptidase (penicillin-binding protein 5/6)